MAEPQSRALVLHALSIGKAAVCVPAATACNAAAVAAEAIKVAGVVDVIDAVDLAVVAAADPEIEVVESLIQD